MTRWLIFRPCRVSFALCVCIAYAVNPDHASHITVGDIPLPIITRRFNYAP